MQETGGLRRDKRKDRTGRKGGGCGHKAGGARTEDGQSRIEKIEEEHENTQTGMEGLTMQTWMDHSSRLLF